MSDDLLDAAREIERLAEKVTPRPWRVDETKTLGAYGVWTDYATHPGHDGEGYESQICSMRPADGDVPRKQRDANAALIVAACNHAPAIARALVEQAERIKELESDLREFGRHSPGCSAEHGDQYRCRCGWRELTKELEAAPAPTPRTYEQGVRDAMAVVDRCKNGWSVSGDVCWTINKCLDALSALLPAKEANGE